MSRLRIAIAQIDCLVGDFSGNAERILAAAARASELGADLLLTPELALSGYPPEDLLLRPDFHRVAAHELQILARRAAERAPGLALLVGHPEARDDLRFNAASLLQDGRITATYHKQNLLDQQVFDERRYFSAGTRPCVLTLKGVRCGVNICADIWEPGAAESTRAAGAELLLVLNASPFHPDKTAQRHEVLRARIAATGMPAIYANLVGGQDELVFDGASFALDAQGRLTHQLPACEEALAIVEYRDGRLLPGEAEAAIATTPSTEAAIYAALKLGVRDYIDKNGFPGAIIGFSGGVDSALVLAIAVDALGAERVRAVMLPSPYTSQMSLDDARAMARNLGVRYDEIPIAPAMQTFSALLAPQFADLPDNPLDTTAENLQARIRGMLLMALSNKTGAIVLTTGNKSEMAVGYATLYGDMAGGFAVLKDVCKTLVYRLCRYRNGLRADIPENILTRAPSAELKPNQTDQDTLPDYATLDAIVTAYMEQDLGPREIVALGHAAADVRQVLALLRRNEYKRRQAPVGIRITRRGFGRDWRCPITSRHQDEW
ncbi:putative glutamine-dependent NAD(+) synthetase [Sterolibacterium denitrificans]|uniref:Glutamine-dependent NAD(+) synthetase n=2 Tax=Sterolibacterium denitrificans TaxID=157592 RepID=A0A656Z8P8_9PROT|nr:NAD+ synthase [Sterolibacterium denitrificans]KYC29373.1 NAD synthetase [Sterolibacterium denitrificans]SMB31175.1 putative glutamine-dependent NAD(+) synthetase [Sterolibacterium denitrificans]